jgi:MEMO1 family protein
VTMPKTEQARVRPAAVAGAFYPAGADELGEVIDAEMARATLRAAAGGGRPKALIVPHAGYVYSGPVAASAYARLLPWRDLIERVVLLGPAHRVPVRSMAVSSADSWDTPLGAVPVDDEARTCVLALPGVEIDDRAHGPEHSLEVELPFLQRILTRPFTVLPIVVGHAPGEEVAAVLEAVWDDDATLLVISSDLSHYEEHGAAALHDRRTADHILAGRVDEIGPHDACGAFPLRGLLAAARRRRLDIELVDLRSSGDTAGPSDRVVGYGSFVLTASAPEVGGGDEAGADPAVTDQVTDRSGSVAAPDAGEGVDFVLTTSAGAPGSATRRPVSGEDLSDDEQDLVLDVAIEAIRAHLEQRTPEPPPGVPEHLEGPAATFVSLRDGRRLLGCIGSIEARRPLLEDVADNAAGAAFRDPRMPSLTPFEFGRMSVHVSVLTPLELLGVTSLDELRDTLVPGVDGLLVEAGRSRGTFLPSVWEQIPAPDDFLTHLWRKAGLTARSWPAHLRAWRYRTLDIGDEGPRSPIRPVAAGPDAETETETGDP